MINVFWILFCTMLVFLMQGGFICLESGLTRSKNNINTAFENLLDMSIVIILYWAIGYGLMYGTSQNGLIGTDLFFLDFNNIDKEKAALILFQIMICCTAVTIISGSISERTRFSAYILISIMTAVLIYPVFGHWAWNGSIQQQDNFRGWLLDFGFVDFAGSTVVHSLGGWVALASVLIIGNRSGRFIDNQEPAQISGANIPMSVLGVVILWVGWLGFNGGSTQVLDERVPSIIANTFIAGASGLLAALIICYVKYGFVKTSWFLNGPLAGLVSITASANAVSTLSAFLIGIVGAIVMILVDLGLQKLKIDDAVGAIPVHLGCGIWGTLAVVFFADPIILGTNLNFWEQLATQLLGIVVCGIWSFGLAYLILGRINKFFPLRVNLEHETLGLNMSEHEASTEIVDLLNSMEKQAVTGDMNLRVLEEPFTLAGQIAKQYNLVLDSLQKMQQQLIQSAKLASLGEMAASIAHELNQPLQVLKLGTENALYFAENDDQKKLHKQFEMMDRNVDKGIQIVNQLRTFGRKTSSKNRKSVAINKCVENVMIMFEKPLQQKNIKISFELNKNLPFFNGNFIQIEQIITNLVVNARDALEEQTEIIEKISEKHIIVRTLKAEQQVILEVEDNAGGIPDDILPHIFESFYTTKSEGVGTGLGLSICNTIIKEHQGSFDVQSKPGEGSTFRVALPIEKNEFPQN